jgi:nitrogen fixation protein FixH
MTDEASKKKDSRLVLGILFTFFAVIFAINFTYIYFAQKTWRGIYTQNSYQKGLEYNKTLEYVKSQKKLGWSFSTNYVNKGNNVGELTVCLLNKNHQPIKNAKLIAQISRPIQEGYDFTQNLMPQNNCYFAKINFPLKGQWVFEIQAFKGEDIFQEVKRYVVQ